MNHLKFAREIGEISGRQFAASITTDLLHSLDFYPHLRFDGSFNIDGISQHDSFAKEAHFGGINSLVVDKFHGRLMVSGGCDGSLKVWDLEACENSSRPLNAIPRVGAQNRQKGHMSGISSVEFDAFDETVFYAASFDETVKQWRPDRSQPSASFDLRAPINCLATSPISSDKLLACATGSPHVRLLDPRTGSSSRVLISSTGIVMAVSWSPNHERLLCSGHADGTIKVWDSRRLSQPLAMLDQADSLGIMHHFNHASLSGLQWTPERHSRASARAHRGSVNGLTWTDDGNYIVSAGLDQHVRVWDAATGANVRVNFQAPLYNKTTKNLSLVVSPGKLSRYSRELLYMPNGIEVLAVELHTGNVVSQLRASSDQVPPSESTGAKRRRTRAKARGAASVSASTSAMANRIQVSHEAAQRVRDIAWRGSNGRNLPLGCDMGGGDSHGAIYAAYGDGTIKVFMPKLPGPLEGDDDIDLGTSERETGRKRKRQGINNVYQSLMSGLR